MKEQPEVKSKTVNEDYEIAESFREYLLLLNELLIEYEKKISAHSSEVEINLENNKTAQCTKNIIINCPDSLKNKKQLQLDIKIFKDVYNLKQDAIELTKKRKTINYKALNNHLEKCHCLVSDIPSSTFTEKVLNMLTILKNKIAQKPCRKVVKTYFWKTTTDVIKDQVENKLITAQLKHTRQQLK